MAAHPELLLRHLRALVPDPSAERPTDAELLDRFARANDEDAFAALVARHGPMVHGVCRRALRNADVAEDVAQAAFLVLARKAKSIRQPESLPAWLHRTSRLLSLKYREGEARRRARETQSLLSAPARTSMDPLDEMTVRELLEIFDEELQRLPERYRLPLILCCLEGCSQEEAARQLGWSPGSVKGRMERGRAILHTRLVCRGLSLSAALVGLEAVRGVSPAAGFIAATTRAALLFTAGTGATDIGLAREIVAIAEVGIRSAAMSRVKILLSFLLVVGVMTSGLTVVAHQGPVATLPAGIQTTVAEQLTEKPPTRIDRHGDPLPAGALARLGTLCSRAGAEVEALAFSPDGKSIACANLDGLFLFDSAGKLAKDIRSAKTSFYPLACSPYHRLAFSPDGRRLACWSMVGPTVEKQVVQVQLQVGLDPIIQRSTQPDVGKRVVQIWDLPAGRKVKEYEAEDLLWLGWSVAGEPLAVNLAKEALLFRELATGKERRLEAKHFSPMFNAYYSCAYASRAKSFAVVDLRGVIHVWDVSTGKKRFAFETNARYVPSLAISPDGRCLASLTHPNPNKDKVQLWDLTTGKTTRTVETDYGGSPPQQYLDTVAFSPDGKTLAMVGWLGLRFYDVATGRERSRTKDDRSFARGVAFSPDGKTLAAMERYGGTIQLWDVATASLKPASVGHTGRPTHIVFSPDGRRVVTGCLDGRMIHWEPTTGKPLLPALRGRNSVDCDFSADGRVFFSCTNGDDLEYIDTDTGRVLNTLKLAVPDRADTRHSGHNIRLANDRKTLVAFSVYRSTKLGAGAPRDLLITGWDVETRKQLFRRQRSNVSSRIVVSPDLKTFAFQPRVARGRSRALNNGVGFEPVRLEDLATGEHLLTLPEVKGETILVNFSPDGRFLVTSTSGSPPKGQAGGRPGAISRTLRLWERDTASEVLSIPAGFEIAFSTDGRLLALTDPAQEIVLWDLRRGKEWQRFKGVNADVTSFAFSPDNKRLISGLSNSTLLVWEVAAERNAEKTPALDASAASRAWTDLAGDARKAFAARGALALSPETALPFLKKHLKPVQPAEPGSIRRLLAELDGDAFAAREKARKELEELGDHASGALQEALKNKPSLEAHRRIEALLKRLKPPISDPETLRSLRAVAILEDIGTSEARKIVEMLAKGSAEARLTREATSTLKRMARRSARGS